MAGSTEFGFSNSGKDVIPGFSICIAVCAAKIRVWILIEQADGKLDSFGIVIIARCYRCRKRMIYRGLAPSINPILNKMTAYVGIAHIF